MTILPPVSSVTIMESRFCSPIISHSANNPGWSSRRISAGRKERGSLSASTYPPSTFAACLENGLARDSAFCVEVEVECVRTIDLVASVVNSRATALPSSTVSGWATSIHLGSELATMRLCFAPSCGWGCFRHKIRRRSTMPKCGSVDTTRSRRSRTRALITETSSRNIWWEVVPRCCEEPATHEPRIDHRLDRSCWRREAGWKIDQRWTRLYSGTQGHTHAIVHFLGNRFKDGGRERRLVEELWTVRKEFQTLCPMVLVDFEGS